MKIKTVLQAKWYAPPAMHDDYYNGDNYVTFVFVVRLWVKKKSQQTSAGNQIWNTERFRFYLLHITQVKDTYTKKNGWSLAVIAHAPCLSKDTITINYIITFYQALCSSMENMGYFSLCIEINRYFPNY